MFKLPKDLCDKITSAMIEFWWSSGDNKEKTSWVAWKYYDPDSLMARILKSKYFKNSSFLTCGMAVWEADRLMLGVA